MRSNKLVITIREKFLYVTYMLISDTSVTMAIVYLEFGDEFL